uniref:Receptor ligand binding region domain-containing protein n=1 Tax=Anopheles coluzzii TaxID=1518534 RepID=A0A8W7PVQ0_ANOCL
MTHPLQPTDTHRPSTIALTSSSHSRATITRSLKWCWNEPELLVAVATRPNGRGPLLKQIKNSAESHIVLDCSTERIYEVLKQAQQIGMMSDYHSYLITSLDLHTINLDEFKYGGTNITAFRLVDPENPEVAQAIHNWTIGEARLGKKVDFKTAPLPPSAALANGSAWPALHVSKLLEREFGHITGRTEGPSIIKHGAPANGTVIVQNETD